jgi:integrase
MQVTSNQFLTEDQLHTFITQACNVDRGFGFQLKFILLANITAQESCSLLWRDVDWENAQIIIRSKKDRSIELGSEIKKFFSMWSREYSPYVFKYRRSASISTLLKKTNKSLSHRADIAMLKKSYSHLAHEAP